MAICLAYFDASGNPSDRNQRELTVAGFVAPEKRWTRFEKKWERVLRDYGVESFHANKMAHWAKPYDAWNRDEQKRIAYLGELIATIKGVVYKAFSSSLYLDDYDAVNSEYCLREFCRPYTLCASQIILNVGRWMHAAHPNDDVLFVFEKGDLDQGNLVKVLERRRMNLAHPPLFLTKKFQENGTTKYRRPFEACDLWAYEDARAYRLLDTGKKLRGSAIHMANQIPHYRGGHDRAGLMEACGLLQLPRRQRSV